MDKKQAFRQARADVIAGKDRRTVFETYKAYVPRPLQLATVIASVPNPERKRRYFALNIFLLILLILAGAFKFFYLVSLFTGNSVVTAYAVALLGLVVPILCAIGVAKFDGQFYIILPIFCVAGLLQVVTHYQGLLSALLDVSFILLIMVLSILIKAKVFPNLGLGGVKKDASGNLMF